MSFEKNILRLVVVPRLCMRSASFLNGEVALLKGDSACSIFLISGEYARGRKAEEDDDEEYDGARQDEAADEAEADAQDGVGNGVEAGAALQ